MTTTAAPTTPIAVSGLTFAYGREPVLKDVTFTLERRAVGLLGPNGSGKTTLLRALLGHLRLGRGQVSVMGCDMARDPRGARRRIGWMPERGGILPAMSGVAMVAYLGELGGMPPTDALQRAHEVLNYVGLADERYRLADTYSQGMRQRLKLAQALVHDPDWLFLDEPTSGLDPSGRIAMLELVRDLAAGKGFGVILSTHLLADVRTVCEEILVLRKGALLDHGRVAARADDDERVFRVEGFGDDAAFTAALEAADVAWEPDARGWILTVPPGGAKCVLQAAAASGFALRRLEKRVETLEDLFFRLVDDADGDGEEE
jgi:ABC-2 type transport system ATP-binding protein